MSTKMKEMIAVIIMVAFFLSAKFLFPKPVEFSPMVSWIIIALLSLAFIIVGVRTFQGKYVERRIVFIFVGEILISDHSELDSAKGNDKPLNPIKSIFE